MSDYQGMRWFKCDLQVQTPADRANWRGESMGEGEEAARAAAEAYIRRCYEIGLEVIAVTDHNFLSKAFIPQLRQAIDALEDEYGYRLILFPGFEFEADVGKGCHVLALFDPDVDLEAIDHCLTDCGVPFPRMQKGVLAKSKKRLPEILNVVQRKTPEGRQRGIVILPHIMTEGGLFDTDKISDWLQQEEFLNPDLLAVEVPKPLSKMSIGFQKLFSADGDCDPAWRRKRPIACVMGSDAKAPRPGENADNPLGKRHTWIKMSKPSIEALRQAFLDSESRIRLPDDPATDRNPAERQHHARLLSVDVSGVDYLQDLALAFSQNLNCIIGGRGSGKSTLVEYLRLALRKDGEDSVRADSRTREKIDRIRETINDPSACIRVRWRSRDGVEDSLVYRRRVGASVEDREIQDADTFFKGLPVRFFSQQQLTELTVREGNNLLPLVDAFVRMELDELDAQERELRADIARLFQVRRQRSVIAAERDRLQQEAAELTRQRSARAGLQEAAQVHERLQAERKVAERTRADISTPAGWVELAEDFVESHSPLGSLAEAWPHGPWFKTLDAQVEQAKQQLLADVKAAVHSYRNSVAALFDKDPEWPAISAALDQADAQFEAACTAQGLTPEEVSRVQEIDRTLRAKQAELDGKQHKLDELDRELGPLPKKYEALLQLWRDQFALREQAAQKAKEAEQTPAARFLDISVMYCGYRPGFDSAWERLCPQDRRASLARAWGDLGEALFQYAVTTNASSPWTALEDLLAAPESAPTPIRESAAVLEKHLQSEAVRSTWEDVKLMRVQDQIDLTLYREDGTCAGSVLEGGLSDGQRNTAALALLLAQGNDPIVIDQPEDELDSNFIYRDLVPMLRAAKEGRQLIFATHNANLPVNGDAELVYALESQGGRGRPLAQGGLDLARVSDAVLDVMEGSREAFQKRREKYHF